MNGRKILIGLVLFVVALALVPAGFALPNRAADRAGIHGAGGARGTGGLTTPVGTPVTVHVTSKGFDWSSAGIGAAAGAALILLALGTTTLQRSRQKETVRRRYSSHSRKESV